MTGDEEGIDEADEDDDEDFDEYDEESEGYHYQRTKSFKQKNYDKDGSH